MSISAINAASTAIQQVQSPAVTTPQAKPASDGDSAAVEAAESSSTKLAEKTNGGFAPKPNTTGGVNKLV